MSLAKGSHLRQFLFALFDKMLVGLNVSSHAGQDYCWEVEKKVMGKSMSAAICVSTLQPSVQNQPNKYFIRWRQVLWFAETTTPLHFCLYFHSCDALQSLYWWPTDNNNLSYLSHFSLSCTKHTHAHKHMYCILPSIVLNFYLWDQNTVYLSDHSAWSKCPVMVSWIRILTASRSPSNKRCIQGQRVNLWNLK